MVRSAAHNSGGGRPRDRAAQRIVGALLGATGAELACLVEYAARGAHDVGAAKLGLRWYPHAEHAGADLPTSRWIERAIRHTLMTGRTTLAAGAWRSRPTLPRRPYQAIVSSAGHHAGAPHRALALLIPAYEIDVTIIAQTERAAHLLLDAPPRAGAGSEPAAPTQTPASALVGLEMQALAHQLRVPLGAASYALEALAMRHPSDWDDEDERLARITRLGIAEAQAIASGAGSAPITEQSSRIPRLGVVSVARVVRRVCELFPGARERIARAIPVGLPDVMADEGWLAQALSNVVDNAVQHTVAPIAIWASAPAGGDDRVRIAVRSFGAAFTLDQTGGQLPNTLDTPVSGARVADLGLRVTRYLVAELGGEIWIERDGHGSSDVVLALPAIIT